MHTIRTHNFTFSHSTNALLYFFYNTWLFYETSAAFKSNTQPSKISQKSALQSFFIFSQFTRELTFEKIHLVDGNGNDRVLVRLGKETLCPCSRELQIYTRDRNFNPKDLYVYTRNQTYTKETYMYTKETNMYTTETMHMHREQ